MKFYNLMKVSKNSRELFEIKLLKKKDRVKKNG